jgi:hypothetical protein
MSYSFAFLSAESQPIEMPKEASTRVASSERHPKPAKNIFGATTAGKFDEQFRETMASAPCGRPQSTLAELHEQPEGGPNTDTAWRQK